MKKYLKLLRVTHYIKNGLIFLPLIFARQINLDSISHTIYGFISFCFISSVVYIINDIKDIEKDRLHPIKKFRPLAAGLISKKFALLSAIFLLLFALMVSYLAAGLNVQVFALLFFYLIINLCYSLGLKNIVLLDIILLVTGFIIRVYYGASIIEVNVSDWLYLTVMSASFFLALGKRRNETIKINSKSRSVLKLYNKEFLDKNIYTFSTLTIIFYSLWAMAQEIKYLVITIPLVILVFMRYTLVIEGDSYGDPVEVLFKDKYLQVLSLLWGIIIMVLMI